MKSYLFALCMLCTISAAFCSRHLTDIDLDDTCCATITGTNRPGSLLVAKDADEDDCEIADDDDARRLYTYAIYRDDTCYIESSYPCSQFVRDGDNNDDDYSNACSTNDAADYNTKFSAAVQKIRTEVQPASSTSTSPPPAENSDDDDNDDGDLDLDTTSSPSPPPSGGDDDDDSASRLAKFCDACQSKCQRLCDVDELTSSGAPYVTQCYICGNENGFCNCDNTEEDD